MNNIEDIIQEITRSTLSSTEWNIINEVLSGKKKLEYGDEEVTPIIKKLNDISSRFEDAKNKREEVQNYVDKKIEFYEMEIDCIEYEIRSYRGKIEDLEDILRKI